MKADRTLQLLHQRFARVEDAGREVFRAERCYRDRPFGIFYFDFSDTILQPEFDLKTYSQERIAPDFYRHEGSLQWNFYLYFVLEHGALEQLRGKARIANIESDQIYARKFVREYETLNSELAAPLTDLLHSTAPQQDLASVWTEKLTAAGLGRVADPHAEYVATVRDYLAGKVATLPGSRAAATPSEPGRFVQSLRLDRFREHPAQEVFKFSTVNLVRGANGTGKTSLFEAIELSICGGIRRQDGVRPREAKIQIQYAGDTKPEICPVADLAIYRARDLHWYGGYYRGRNQLCHNFARFNFFDSDAAFRLSSAKDNNEIVQALDSLLLGELATSIEERMKQFQDRFSQQERELKRHRTKYAQDRLRASQQLEELKAIKDTREVLFRELQCQGADCGWLKLPTKPTVGDLAALREDIANLAEKLSQHVARLPWLARVSVSTLSREAKQLGEAFKALANQRKLAKTVDAAVEQADARIAEAEAQLKLLRRLNEFHAQPNGMSLLGSGAAVKDAKARLALFKEAASRLRGIELAKYAPIGATLAELASQHANETTKRRRSLARLNKRAADLQAQIGDIKSVVQEIKGLGQRFCQLSPDSTDCPLCGARYELLADQIAKIEFGSPLEKAVRELAAETNREQAELEKLAKVSAEVARLSEAAQLVLPANQIAIRSAKSVVESLANLPERQAAEKLKLDEMVAAQKRLELGGFSEEELDELLKSAQEEHSLARSRLLRKDSAQLLAKEVNDALEALGNKRRDDQKQRKEIEAEIRRIVKAVADELRPDTAELELERRQTVVEDVLVAIHIARKSVAMADAEEISTAQAHLEAFAKVVARLQESLQRVEQKGKLEENATALLATAKTELDRVVPQHERAKAAVALLAELLGSDYKLAFTRRVLEDHQAKLSTIFSRIHAPNEFKDVSLSPDLLLGRHNGTTSAISEISTGQRAALALSIFLSLNSSVSSRAPWLIFDDPIVQVDDLNILSFLDMLRDLVLLGDRQVFFSTANARIADLFTKKFDCLGDEFRPFALTR